MNKLRVYIRQVLIEMAAPRPIDLDAVYYHGTPTRANAEDIMINGIKAPDLTNREGYLRPVEGKVYITPEIRYAQIYALGGDLAGTETSRDIERYGQYGYVFVIDGQQLKDIQPDEDTVGEMIYNEEYDWLNDLAEEYLKYEDYNDYGMDLGYRSLYHAIMGGEYDAWAAGGKILLDVMDNEQMLELIDDGAHIAHAGTLIPKQAWRFDRTKTINLAKDGSNFFKLAEQIK